jgi:hypothetical protein
MWLERKKSPQLFKKYWPGDVLCMQKEGRWSHAVRCKGTKIWRDELVDKRFTGTCICLEIGITRTV